MPLYEFLCEAGHVEERLSVIGASTSQCSCGGTSTRVWSTFALRSYQTDRSGWDLIAPLNDEGKPMTMKEAARSGRIDRYSPDERARDESHAREQQERLTKDRMEAAKRDAWREVSAKRRIEVR